MKHTHLRSNTYHYRRRTPTCLYSYIDKPYITKALSTDASASSLLSAKLDVIINELVVMSKVGLTPDISRLGLSAPTISPITAFLTTVDRAESGQKLTEIHMELLELLLPKDISVTTHEIIDKAVAALKALPKRNIQKYKEIPVKKLLTMEIPEKDRLAPRGVNAYLKTLRAFVTFCYKRSYMSREYDVNLVKKSVSARDERVALDKHAIGSLEHIISDKLRSAYKLLYLTGMRPSEAYKCSVREVDGVRCFDLTDRSIKLKNANSYRLIPVHSSLKDPEKMLVSLRTMSSDFLGKKFKTVFDTGTLYSLRHTFADHLAKEGVPLHLISELTGHAHGSQTGDRYIKGFDIKLLKESVEKLPGR